MATASKQPNTGSSSGRAQNSTSDVGSPISNEAYDVISALSSKLEGLEAYRKYSQNGNEDLWQQLTSTEVQGVERLVDELERLVREDKFRLRQPGRADAE
jgi:flagellar biosynthesis chaperone FliJ